MNAQINNSQNKLYNLFTEFFSFAKLSELQRQEIFTKLEGAIMLNIINRALDLLSDNDKKKIGQQEFKTNTDLLKVLSEKINKERFQECAEQSIKEIVMKFIDRTN